MNADLIARRFWERVEVRTSDECWPWTGSKLKKDGRGMLSVGRKNIPAPRISWALHFGEPPAELFVCHSCDNANCVNPKHLWLGTNRDNGIDSARKGRNPAQNGAATKGSKHWRARLDESAVSEIRKRLAAGEGQRALAREYGVAHCSIFDIAHGKGWAHVK